MANIQRTSFTKGVVSDLSPSKVQPGQWVFPSENIRIINLDGKGFSVTPINSNEQVASCQGEFNTFSEDVICLGGTAYKGVIYLALFDPRTGESSLATYPSPRAITDIHRDETQTGSPLVATIDNSQKGYKNTLNPIVNTIRENSNIAPFTSQKMNFSPENMVQILCKESYDQSLDLYLCDDRNPVRVINSAFSVTGDWLDRYYNVLSSIDEKVDSGFFNIVPSLNTPPTVRFVEINNYGALPPGTYYLFVRYVTQDYARTQFYAPMGPVTILEGNSGTRVCGSSGFDYNGENVNTNKAIVFNVEQDTEYNYFEIAVVRYTEDKDGVLFRDVYIVDKLYSMTNNNVVLYGSEEKATFTKEEIVYSVEIETIARSLTTVDKRLLLGHTRKNMANESVILEWCQKISVSGKKQSITENIDEVNPSITDYRRYQRAEEVLNEMGYFPKEIYPFGIVLLTKDNTLSRVYPISGSMMNQGEANNNGLFMFPGCGSLKQYLMAMFTITELPPQELLDSAIGFYFVRGERINNLVANGILFPTMRGNVYLNNSDVTNPSPDDCWNAFPPQFVPLDKLGNGKDPVYYYKYFGNTIRPEDAYSVPMYAKVYNYELFPGWNCQKGYSRLGFPVGLKDNRADEIFSYFDTQNGAGYHCQGDFDYPPSWTDPKTQKSQDYGMFDKHRFALFAWDYMINQEKVNEEGDLDLEMCSTYEDSHALNIDSKPNHGYVKFDHGEEYPESYRTIRCVNVETNIPRGYMHFASILKDGLRNNGTGFEGYCEISPGDLYPHTTGWVGGTPIKFKTTWYSRSYNCPRYIGILDNIDNPENTPVLDVLSPMHHINEFKYSNVTLRQSRPNVAFFRQSNMGFQINGHPYYIISDFIPLANLSLVPFVIGHGDAFTTSGFFRYAGWFDQDTNNGDEPKNKDDDGIYYEWGELVGFRSRSTVCPYHRNPVKSLVKDENGNDVVRTYSFYPRLLGDNIPVKDWLTHVVEDYYYESMRVNPGYSYTSPEVNVLGYDDKAVTEIYRRPTRLRVTDRSVPGSYRDGWRRMGSANYVDLDPRDGDITSVHNLVGNLVVVQERGTVQVPYGPRELSVDNTVSKVILSQSDYILDANTKPIANFGSQHRFGAKCTDAGLFGMDFDQEIIWFMGSQMQDIGKESLNETEIHARCQGIRELLGNARLEDKPVLGNGVVVGYNPGLSEIYFNVMMEKIVSGGGNADSMMNLAGKQFGFIYNTKSRQLTGTSTMISPVMFDNDKKLFMVKPDFSAEVPLHNGLPITVKPGIYLSEKADSYLQFFDKQHTMSISFVVNGLTAETDLTTFEKIYEALILFSNHVAPKKITYKTKYQEISKLFDTSSEDFWELPEYQEDKWLIPSPICTQADSVEYQNFSELRGPHLLVTIEYEGSDLLVIDGIISKFSPLNI